VTGEWIWLIISISQGWNNGACRRIKQHRSLQLTHCSGWYMKVLSLGTDICVEVSYGCLFVESSYSCFC
jgi:hypothetical protein